MHRSINGDIRMGVRRLFSRGGQNFPGGAKTYYFGQPEGVKGPLLPSPADANGHTVIVFRGSWSSSVNWLEPETEPL